MGQRQLLSSRRNLALLLIASSTLATSSLWLAAKAQDAQSDDTVIRRVVDMVQLNVAVTDRQGKYVTGLKPSDFVITEDRTPQQIATFESGTAGPQTVTATAGIAPPAGNAAGGPAAPPERPGETGRGNQSPAPKSSSCSIPATTCITPAALFRTGLLFRFYPLDGRSRAFGFLSYSRDFTRVTR
jgi:hypothetical protein